MCKTKKPKDNSAKIAAQQEAERQARIAEGTNRINSQFSQFDDNYFNGIADAYKAHYTPQIEEQYQAARKNMMYNPAGGSTSSSAFAARLGELERDRQRQMVEIANRGLSEAQNYRSNVVSNKQNLIGQLNAGSGVDSVSSLAAEQAKSLTATPTYSALGDLFSRFATNANNYVNSNTNSNNQNNSLLFNTGNRAGKEVVVSR